MQDNAPQPDSHLIVLPEYEGQSHRERKYSAGAPELAAEVCGSSAAHDFGPKLALYQRAGVREYITVTLEPAGVLWRHLAGDGSYAMLDRDADGLLRSRAFAGLWLDPDALLALDGAAVWSALQRGLASPEHARFVDRLQKR
jgi:hypothetical protein